MTIKNIYHITWATHGSRINERVKTYNSRYTNPIILDEISRQIITESIAEKIQKQSYKIFAVNILRDHVHSIIESKNDEISSIIKHLKGFSSLKHNKLCEWTIPKEGQQIRLWAKGSNKVLIESDDQLLRVIQYVENNHIKHQDIKNFSSLYNPILKKIIYSSRQLKLAVPERSRGAVLCFHNILL